MIKKNAMIYIVIGIVLTIAGIIFTGLGSYMQNKETNVFQHTITGLSLQSSEKQDEISTYSRKNIELAEKLAEQTEKSNKELTRLSIKNSELTQRLTEISEDRFRRLTIPSMNVIRVEEDLSHGLNSFFKIVAKNTGNNDCSDARLIIDRHNSPMVSTSEIQNFTKVPKDDTVEYSIPIFQSDLMVRISNEDTKQDFKDNFLKKFKENEMVIIFFHFEYQWGKETLKSSQYNIFRSKTDKLYISSSEDYIEFEDKVPPPKWFR